MNTVKDNLNLLRPTSCGSDVRLHNILTVWLACRGVDAWAFPGLAAPSSSNCRSVNTPTSKESVHWGEQASWFMSVKPLLRVTANLLILLLTCTWWTPWLGPEQEQVRHCLGLHQPCSPGPCCHGNGFSTVHLFHNCRPTFLNTVQLWLHRLPKRQETNLPSQKHESNATIKKQSTDVWWT